MKTFSNGQPKGLNVLKTDTLFAENLAEIVKLTSSVTPEDVYFDSNLVLDRGMGRAPVTYIDLFENHLATLGIFVLNNVFTLPLHDHPSMFGFVKVLFGKVRVRSYTEVLVDPPNDLLRISHERDRRIVTVKLANEFEANQDSPATVLTPSECNFHSISSVDGPAAFLDLLSPPYDYKTRQRICHYYSEISPESCSSDGIRSTTNSDFLYLIEKDEPEDFYCDSAKYRGPPLTI